MKQRNQIQRKRKKRRKNEKKKKKNESIAKDIDEKQTRED